MAHCPRLRLVGSAMRTSSSVEVRMADPPKGAFAGDPSGADSGGASATRYG